jgi:peptidyl-prolyl cis-trans isomerase SurA
MRLFKSFQTLLPCVILHFATASALDKVDGVAAVIGDSVILNSEVDAYSLMRLNNAGQKTDSTELPKARKRFLNELIDGKILIVHAAKDTNIVVKEAEVEAAMNNQVQMILQQNGISLATLEQELKTKYGMNLSKFKAQMRTQIQEQLIRQKVQQLYVSSSVQITRKDVESFYSLYRDSLPLMGESVQLSKLTLRLSPTDSTRQAAYSKISGIKQRLDNGEDFAKLAKQYSDDPSSDSGGDLGFIKKGTLGELIFEEKAFSLNPGQTSDIFESRLGYHIISMVDRKDQMVHIRQIFVQVNPSAKMVQKITDKLDSIRTHCAAKPDFVAAVKQLSDRQSGQRRRTVKMGWVNPCMKCPKPSVAVSRQSARRALSAKPVRDGATLYALSRRRSANRRRNR